MFSRSLRSKIFLLVVAILLVVAAFIMLTSRRDVTRTVSASERHAVSNVMDLVRRDIDARWASLLEDKVDMVRSGRRQLLETGTIVASVLAGYADMAERGVVTPGAAKGMARAWIDHLRFDQRRYAFVYDANGQVLASGNPSMIDRDLTGVTDFKGRPLASALYEESHNSGYGFAIYRWPPRAGMAEEARYAYFGYFRPWDWVIAVTDSVQDVIDQVDTRREQMQNALRDTLARLTLARSGFVFIVADDDELIVPPPARAAALLQANDARSGKPLRDMLRGVTAASSTQVIEFDAGDDALHIEALRFKPLGWTVVAVVPESDFAAPAAAVLNRQAMIFAATLLLALLCAWPVSAHIVRPLRTLTRYARELPRQDLTAPSAVPAHIAGLPARYRDEVGRLASSFLFMDRRLRENVSRLMQETTARERFESELNIARAIQLGLLPVPLPPEILERADLHAVMQPAKQVGGDLYDYFLLSNGKLCLAIGDVSDKGVPAALFMAVTRTLIRATAEDETDPAAIMSRVNNRLAENNPNLMFVTLLLGVLDLDTGELQWANAGHPPPALMGADGAVRLMEGRSGPACGVQEGIAYHALSTRLESGETLVGYTDGVTDATNALGGHYGTQRMLDTLARPGASATRLTERLLDDIHAYAKDVEQTDDITLIVLRRP
ncbi:SpoIIE family protein phosphatase [Bordetella bronchialis]|uniref:Regulator n=1 Tax=Bordetella bronchialis TaxID=463025 RepID=A0A193FJ72_9BORD|nr:SpoIIE family protein phosphatase [Bordetella bronchialis]ANN67283.1 regulator [Bordetella bronchialis]ANN72372.1 regulator [Bordetella bronchialis]